MEFIDRNKEYVEGLIKKANILTEALPYIQKLNKKRVVIKYGGNAMLNDEIKKSVIQDITLLKFIGINPIIVHGGGPDISNALKAYNIESKFINGLRVTEKDTVGVAQMVLVGKTNKELVSLLNHEGGKAIGLCGIDGNLLKCKKLYTDVDGVKTDIGFVGEVIEVNTKIIEMLNDDEFIPVIAPIGVDDEGNSYNINADSVAEAVAEALHAEKLMYLTDVEGVKNADGELIYKIHLDEINAMIEDGTITGGMIPKIKGCEKAIKNGVGKVHIIDGRLLHSILLEIFTDTGIGTMITE
ncbi:MAG: acetylglutamate kinase [Ruminococcaceae bacterium]|nr:acetylglutamate kinase [Oscillospiraceae bacterium]